MLNAGESVETTKILIFVVVYRERNVRGSITEYSSIDILSNPSLSLQAVCQSVSDGTGQDGVSMAVMQRTPKAVVSELFSSVRAEIRDEVTFCCVLIRSSAKS